ncbi:MAG: MgtC/SapB family protein [Solobacterium sp.]|nr:MgtC/SapB family protein [Solobacterium sp.]
MLSIFNGLRGMTFFPILFRMVMGFIAGGVIGLERSYKNKSAGFRTHILVCIGAVVASMTGQYLYLVLGLSADMSRIPTQVISGISFIGAGTIVVTRNKTVKGLTTAAGIWTTAIIGIAIGAGFYEGALIAIALVLLCETYFADVRSRIVHYPVFKIVLSYYNRQDFDKVLRMCKDDNMSITNLQITGSSQDGTAVYSALLSLRPGGEVDPKALAKRFEEMPGIISAEVM